MGITHKLAHQNGGDCWPFGEHQRIPQQEVDETIQNQQQQHSNGKSTESEVGKLDFNFQFCLFMLNQLC